MKSITQLRDWIYPLPTRFAVDREANDIPATSGDDELNFVDGFPRVYSENPKGESPIGIGRYLLRKDFNSFGEMSSRESVFREAGGVHTFSSDAMDQAGGYPEGAMLSAYDGEYLAKVESTESKNKKAFIDAAGNIEPGVIDCFTTDTDDSDDAEKRVLWHSAGWIYGQEEGMFRLYLDFTRAKILPQGGGVISEDSLVVGILVSMTALQGNDSIDALTSLEHTTNISGTITNKGKCGEILGYTMLGWIEDSGVSFKQIPVVRATGGTGNYAMSFFAKAGSSFSGKGKANGIERDILWFAIPIKAEIRTAGEEE